MNPIRSRPAATGFLLAAVVVIVVATLTPRPGDSPSTTWWCLVCGQLGGIDFLQNVALFVPFGLGLAWSRVSGLGAILLGVGFSIAIEAAQLALIPGRDAGLGDLVANGFGTGLGWSVVIGWRRWWWPPADGWDRSLLCALVVAAATAGGGWLLTPGYTQIAWFGQLTPALGHLDQFAGTATDLRLNDNPLMVGGEPSRAVGGSTVSVAGRVTRPGGLTRRVAPIVSVFDAHQGEQILLGQHGHQVVFRARTRANAWRLQSIAVGVPDVFGPESRSAFDALGTRRDAELIVSATDDRQARTARLRLTPALGWTTVLPFVYVHRSALVTTGASLLWLGMLGAPLGWFASHRATAVLAAMVVVAALGVPALASGLALPGPLEVIGLVGGWSLGWWARQRLGPPKNPLPGRWDGASFR